MWDAAHGSGGSTSGGGQRAQRASNAGIQQRPHKRASIFRRITAYQIFGLATAMFMINVVISALVAAFLATQFSAAAVAVVGAETAQAGANAAEPPVESLAEPLVERPTEPLAEPHVERPTEPLVERPTEPLADGARARTELFGAPIGNALIDGYVATGFADGSEPQEPTGWRLPSPLAAMLRLPDGTRMAAELWQTGNLSLTNSWFAVRSVFAFPLAAAPGYGIVTLSHDTLFWHLWVGLSILLGIETIIFINRALKIRRAVRRMLRPINELTIAAQSELTIASKSGFRDASQKMPPGKRGGGDMRGADVMRGADGMRNADDVYADGLYADGMHASGILTDGMHASGMLADGMHASGMRGADDMGGADGMHADGLSSSAAAELKLSGAIDTINAITERDLDRRISIEDEREELQGLADAINGMLNRLDAAYRAQLRFVSDASHELRTPISVIQGYANLLDRWGKNDEKTLQESIDAIKHEAVSMQALVEQLLFLARVENRTIAPTPATTDISALVEETVREARMIDETHEFTSAVEPGLAIQCDANLIKQALRILIDNSVKYSPEGSCISVKAARSASRPGYVDISVQDSGIGIPSEALPHIFERFYRADESRARDTGGTGLGLAIAKWIIDIHGGFVDIISRKDAGTRITMSYPMDD